tara:strand:+ start:482 stop:1219 length:738 start_codon:yes stop_codon:yes gene_type:complete
MTVTTPNGDIELLQPEPSRLRNLRELLTLGAVQIERESTGARFGIVMKCGEREVFGVKQQPPDIPEDWAENQFFINSILIAHTIASYLKHGFSGVLMPCPYWRKKQGKAEVGFAYFGWPSPNGIESNEFEFRAAFDSQLGHGFTQMLISFVEALKVSAEETGLMMQPTIGLDYRSRTALETIGLSFLVQGRDLFALKTVVSEKDPSWAVIRSMGIKKVYHLPSVPMEIEEEELKIAKPEFGISDE